MTGFGNAKLRRQGRGGLSLLLACALAFLAAPSGSSAQDSKGLYASKPSWWDSVSAELGDAQGSARQLSERAFALFSQKTSERVKDWELIGPFDSNGGDPWSFEYPPEKAKFDPKASYQGKSGAVSWVKWEEGKPFPFEGSADDSVFFLRASLPKGKACPFLLLASSCGLELKLDKASVCSSHGRRVYDERNPDVLQPSGRLGSSPELLAKLHNLAGRPQIALWLSTAMPVHVRIKFMTQAVASAKPGDQSVDELSGEIAALYQRLDDWPNSAFWRERQFAASSVNVKRRLVKDWSEMARRGQASSERVVSLLDSVFNSLPAGSELKAPVAAEMLALMLDRNEVNAMLSFLESRRAELEPLMQDDLSKFKLRAFIRKGDSKQANELLKEMEEGPSGARLHADKDFLNLKRSVESVNATSMQLPVDWGYDAAMRNLSKLEQDPVKMKLCNFIRSCLSEKGSFLIDTGDPELFLGALPKYKEAFKAHSGDYNKSLEEYFALLKGKLAYSDSMLMSRRALLSLDAAGPARQPAPDSLPGWPEPSPALPAVKGSFQPLTDIAPGSFDAALDQDPISERLLKSPSVGACSAGSKTFIQNSRQTLCLEGSNILWRRVLPPSSIKGPADESGNRARYSVFPGQFVPCVKGKSVFVRMLSDGLFRLFALRADNGRTIWSLSEGAFSICSNPVLWREKVVVLAKVQDSISRYSLLIVDAASGRLETSMPLYSTADLAPFGRGLGSVAFDLFVPPPSIADDMAYVNTNAGVLVAVDLLSGSLLWERKYPRIPFSISDELSRSVEARKPLSPVVGKDSVLFAPLDSLGLLLLSRDGGGLLAERTGLMWTDIVPLGAPASSAIAFDSSGSTVISLSSLASVRAAPFASSASPLAFSSQRLLLKRPGLLEIFDSSLKSVQRVAVPEDFSVVAASKDLLIGFQSSTQQPVLGLLSVQPVLSAKDYKPQPPESFGSQLQDPCLMKAGQDFYIVALDSVSKLDDSLNPAWSFPIPNFKGAPFQTKDSVFLSNGRRAFLLDKATGSVLNSFPEPSAPSFKRIWAESPSSDRVCFATETPNVFDSVQICSLSAKEGQRIAPFKREDGVVFSIFNGGELVLAYSQRQKALVFYRLQGGAYFKTASQIAFPKEFWTAKCFQVDESCAAVKSSLENVVYIAKSDMSLVAVPIRPGDWSSRSGSLSYEDIKVEGGVLCAKLHPQGVSMIDLAKGVDLGLSWQIDSLPFFANGILMGAKRNPNPKRPCTLSSYSLAASKVLCSSDADVSALGISRVGSRYKFGVEIDGALYSALTPEGGRDFFGSGALVVQKPGSPDLSVSSFPDFEKFGGALYKGGFLLLLVEGSPRKLSKEEFLSLRGASKFISAGAPEPVNFCLDGYLDEWSPDSFCKVGKSSFQAAFAKDSLLIAGIIADERALEALGPDGLSNDATLSLLPGDLATFRDSSVREGYPFGLRAPFKRDGETPFKSSFAMSPAGDSLSFEIEVPYEKLFRDGKLNEGLFTSNPSRNLRGDLAFEILVDFQDGSRRGVFSGGEIPAFFPRAMFPAKTPGLPPPKAPAKAPPAKK